MAPVLGPQVTLLWSAVLIALTWGQVFQPSFILMTSRTASSFLVAKEFNITHFTAIEVDNAVGLPSPNCSGINQTKDWHLDSNKLQTENIFKVTLTWSSPLCSINETNCCTLCVVRTFLLVACQSSTVVASLVIQAEIYSNSTFTGTVSENATVIPNQVYHPLGACPCNLTAGACDIGCCCDQECKNLSRLFNGFCYAGVFGGNVTPSFDQLCTVQTDNNSPDWFPFLCVQSTLENSPFLGYFYQGSTVSPSQLSSFKAPFQANIQESTVGYRQGDPILTDTNEYFTIPQPMGEHCINNAPVAYLQNFDVSCVRPLTSENIAAVTASKIRSGSGGFVTLNVTSSLVDPNNFIMSTDAGGGTLTNSCVNVTVEASYTFIWERNKINAINVAVSLINICLNKSAIVIQRFVANFVSVNSSLPLRTLSGNPGYHLGKPVLALGANASRNIGTLNLWTTAGRGFCSSSTPTPILFGEDSTRGCLLNMNLNGNCSHLGEEIVRFLKSFTQVKYVAMRGNSNATDLTEWVEIIYAEPNKTGMNFGRVNGLCLRVPANMNIQIIIGNIGAVEGIPQQAILGAKINFSTVTFNCEDSCSNFSFPISASVQFIKVPAAQQSALTSFQLNYTEYDCDRNEVCWPQLAYPMTQYYTGEPYADALGKGMVLVGFFILAAVLGGPWNKIRQAWNKTTF
ncbi:tectonic-2 [Pleurodeles waltl]|uniref:tectonic-2 n=1 Tax=Pleurodeles waltl TaxID=8319 RepID=UPI003709B7D4